MNNHIVDRLSCNILSGFLSSTLNGLIKDPPEVVHFVVSTLQGRVSWLSSLHVNYYFISSYIFPLFIVC